ncbi:MAG: 2-amino-3-ketobutyrate CoA ligase, partial [Prevotellaceae bacterium]|nr:2-amino-3-ketobutyrate CoA ligase [Prevotellaceae bacterium]
FGGLSIQEVCDRAEIEPQVFYRRYPEGFAFYVEKFIRDHDFWFSHYQEYPVEKLNRSPEDLTQILLSLWTQIAEDGLLASLLRLELQDTPLEAAVEIAKARELQTEGLVEFFAKASESPNTLRVQLAILTAGIQYLALHKDVSTFCGIDFTSIPKEEIEVALMQILKPIMRLK